MTSTFSSLRFDGKLSSAPTLRLQMMNSQVTRLLAPDTKCQSCSFKSRRSSNDVPFRHVSHSRLKPSICTSHIARWSIFAWRVMSQNQERRVNDSKKTFSFYFVVPLGSMQHTSQSASSPTVINTRQTPSKCESALRECARKNWTKGFMWWINEFLVLHFSLPSSRGTQTRWYLIHKRLQRSRPSVVLEVCLYTNPSEMLFRLTPYASLMEVHVGTKTKHQHHDGRRVRTMASLSLGVVCARVVKILILRQKGKTNESKF